MIESLMDLNGKKVIVIANEADLGMFMRAFFMKKNCEVVVCQTPSQVFKSLNKEIPDIIWLTRSFDDETGIVAQIHQVRPDIQIILQEESAPRKE